MALDFKQINGHILADITMFRLLLALLKQKRRNYRLNKSLFYSTIAQNPAEI